MCRKTHASLAAITDRFRRDQNQTFVLPLNDSVRLLITGDAILMYSVPRDIRQTFSFFSQLRYVLPLDVAEFVCVSVSALPGGWFSFFRVKVASLSKKMAAWLYSAASSLIVFSFCIYCCFECSSCCSFRFFFCCSWQCL